jgi:ubiquinone/menaquinone biosynthesis C-methylase UbiE
MQYLLLSPLSKLEPLDRLLLPSIESGYIMPSHPDLGDYKQRLAASFDQRSHYDDDYTRRRALRLVELAGLERGKAVLDLATGTGLVAIAAARVVGRQGKVVGADISPGMLDLARQKLMEEGLRNIELIEADVEALDFEAETFNAILCSSAMMWMSNIPATLRSCRRWLKTGGLLAFSCYSTSSFTIPIVVRACAKFGISLPNCNEPLGTHEKCRKLLQEAGFENADIRTEQFGSYLSLADAKREWKGDSNWIDPRGNPLAGLSSERLREIRSAYESEIDVLATDQGFWHEITMFFVTVRK